MSEPVPDYDGPRIVTCQVCGCEIGQLVAIYDQYWLQVGGVICRNVFGVCVRCQKPYHWSASDVMLAELVRHTFILRNVV